MSPRKIFENEAEQRKHENNCDLLRRAVFSGGKARKVAEDELRKHPACEIHETILDLRAKRELLVEDLKELTTACDRFWQNAFLPSGDHSGDCSLQRDVWRRAFHVAHAAESLTASLLASARRFAKRKRVEGEIEYEFTVAGFASRWEAFKQSPLFQFNRTFRGILFHSRLINPDWVGHINFISGIRRERFLLKKSVLYAAVQWESKAREYIEQYSVASDGSRGDARQQPIGVDLIDHYVRYTEAIRELVDWFLGELSRPDFGASLGLHPHALEEYFDWITETTSTPSEVVLCEYCGHPFKMRRAEKSEER